MDLTGRVALITGGATGIGRATALRLARTGAAAVAVNYRTAKAEADEVVAELRRIGVEAAGVAADVRSDAEVREMVRQVEAGFGRLDVLVNNAGVTRWIPLTDLEALTDDVWDDIFDVNVKGAFRCTRAAAPLLARTQGIVINVASVAGVLTTPTMSSLAYGTSKAALIYLTRGLAMALAPDVRVNAVAPAFTDTPWMRKHHGDEFERVAARAASLYPLRRVAVADEVAGAIVGLVTGGDFVTGQTMVVDGGLSLG